MYKNIVPGVVLVRVTYGGRAEIGRSTELTRTGW